MIEVLVEISSILYCMIKYILLKMYVVEKKSEWIVLQYEIIITKYLNIAIIIAFPSNTSMHTRLL